MRRLRYPCRGACKETGEWPGYWITGRSNTLHTCRRSRRGLPLVWRGISSGVSGLAQSRIVKNSDWQRAGQYKMGKPRPERRLWDAKNGHALAPFLSASCLKVSWLGVISGTPPIVCRVAAGAVLPDIPDDGTQGRCAHESHGHCPGSIARRRA